MSTVVVLEERPDRTDSPSLILIVDDDPIIRSLLRDELEDNGLRVREAENGIDAIESCHELQPDLLIVDAVMPLMDGFELCQIVRQSPTTRHVPILMATGLHDVDSIKRAFEAGATDFVSKPLNWPIITQRVRYMLRTARVADDLRESQDRLYSAEASRRTHARRFEAALDNMSQGLCMVGEDGNVIVTNQRFLDLYQLTSSSVTAGMSLVDLMDASPLFDARENRRKESPLAGYLSLTKRPVSDTLSQELGDGRVIAITHEPMTDGGFVDTFTDITERRRTELQIAHMATHDPLTDLPNRVLFRLRLEEALRQVPGGMNCAVLYLDLDRFKNVNDTLGHPIGDALLQAVADRLRAIVRRTAMAARLGGDEFAIVQTCAAYPGDTTALAERLRHDLAEPFHVAGHKVTIGTSIGIAVGPRDTMDPDRLLQCADMALYEAKASGRNRYRYFETHLSDAVEFRQMLEHDLANALAADEFELYYQPLMNLRTKRITGFEALLRWNSPRHGKVSPATFIPIAEESGQIERIGAWVLRTACAQAATWPENVKVSVNISAIQFRNGQLVRLVSEALRSSRLDPHGLELEITESILIDDFRGTVAQLHQLRNMGISIAMDDFGTGYSSLGYLRSFPFDKLKIDQSFVRDLSENPGSTAIVRAITGICTSLGIVATAEGVETTRQLEILMAEGCQEVQGFLMSQPQPARCVPDILLAHERDWILNPSFNLTGSLESAARRHS
jgi:diguanylate cyclase (GGDEF)-like protein